MCVLVGTSCADVWFSAVGRSDLSNVSSARVSSIVLVGDPSADGPRGRRVDLVPALVTPS